MNFSKPTYIRRLSTPPVKSKSGLASLVYLALLSIMMILATAETRAIIHLHREVKLLEQTQIKRLDHSTGQSAGSSTAAATPASEANQK